MKLDTALHVSGLALPSGGGALVSTLMMLIDTLSEPGADGDGDVRFEAAQHAIDTALCVEQEMADLHGRIARLEKLALTDELTGLLNRRGFESELKRTLALARRHGETGVVLIVDLDGFKLVNDTYGHAAGDEMLRHVGRILTRSVRRTDLVARLGGDEFGVVLMRADAEGGFRRSQAIERILNSTVVVWGSAPIAVRASIGVRPFGPDDDMDAVFGEADAAMYQSKQLRGRSLARLGVS